MDCSLPSPSLHGISQARIFPGKNTRVGCHFFFQGIIPTQGSNPCCLHWHIDFFTTEPPKEPDERRPRSPTNATREARRVISVLGVTTKQPPSRCPGKRFPGEAPRASRQEVSSPRVSALRQLCATVATAIITIVIITAFLLSATVPQAQQG